MSGDVFRVIFVCTGNRFRSPLAAALFRAAADGLPVEVSSAGTLELTDVGALPEAEDAAREFGVDLSTHHATPVSRTPLSDVDLVVGFERMHVLTAVVDGGAQRGRSFTLPELAVLLGQVGRPVLAAPVARARETIRRAAAERPRDDPQLLSVRELGDPLGLQPDRQHAIALQVRDLTLELWDRLFG